MWWLLLMSKNRNLSFSWITARSMSSTYDNDIFSLDKFSSVSDVVAFVN
jgi:hypothetical protein